MQQDDFSRGLCLTADTAEDIHILDGLVKIRIFKHGTHIRIKFLADKAIPIIRVKNGLERTSLTSRTPKAKKA